jgi:hypothetical protein
MSAVGDREGTGVGRSASVIAAAWKSDIHRGCRVGWVGARVSLSRVTHRLAPPRRACARRTPG